MSLLFLLVYGTCNWFTSLRSDVGVWVYEWERYIPFVPLMIVPYMSIDLFFVAAPFLCTSRREMSILSRRIVLAILVAGFFFLVMPLRFSFERPHVEGWLGAVFNAFREMDKPFNQFPSLHIALRTILADVYARHTRGVTRWASHVWFSLIGFSTVLTYQHHVIDVVGGFLLAWLCFYVFDEAPWRMPVARNWRVGAYYLAGAGILTAGAALLWPWGALLLWPAVALAVVAGGYFGLGPGVFRKHQGRLPLATRLLLAPLILGQKLSLKHYARRSRPWDRITDHLWLGRTLNDAEAGAALEAGVGAVLDLTVELPECAPFRCLPHYRHLPVLDLTAPTDAHFRDALAFIERHARDGTVVYVHCKAGYSRSAAVAAAYLLHSGRASTAADAVAQIRTARPGIILRPEAVRAVCRFADAAARVPEPLPA